MLYGQTCFVLFAGLVTDRPTPSSVTSPTNPPQPLWNFILLGVSIPEHAQLALFLWGGRGSVQRPEQVLAAVVVNFLPMIAGDLTT